MGAKSSKVVSEAPSSRSSFERMASVRDYFTARDASHAYYWIFRQWRGGEWSDEEPQWFLHGLFG